MTTTAQTIRVYTAQDAARIALLEQADVCYAERAAVETAYQDSAAVLLAANDWLSAQLAKYVPKPPGADYPFLAFRERHSVEACGEATLLALDVPLDEAVFFDAFDWTTIRRLQYLGASAKEEAAFRQTLADYGIRRESDVILTNFYPDLKREVTAS